MHTDKDVDLMTYNEIMNRVDTILKYSAYPQTGKFEFVTYTEKDKQLDSLCNEALSRFKQRKGLN